MIKVNKMKPTLAVQKFLDRTQTNFKHYCFVIIESDNQDSIVNLSVAEVASTFTRRGGKLSKLNTDDLAKKYAALHQWKLLGFHIADGV